MNDSESERPKPSGTSIDEEIAALWVRQLNQIQEGSDFDRFKSFLDHLGIELIDEGTNTSDTAIPGLNVVMQGLDVVGSIDEAADTSETAIRTAYPKSLRIFEEGIRWLAEVHLTLSATMVWDRRGHRKTRVRSVWALIGTASAYAVAVRRLVLAGLDGPARVVLRSLSETLFVCIVLLHRDDLRTEYERAAKDENEAFKLWRREFAWAKLKHHLDSAEQYAAESVAAQSDDQSADWREWADWRNEHFRTMSEFVHPRYVSAALTAAPLWPDSHELGLLGAPSMGAGLTLKDASRLFWYFAALGGYLLFRIPDGLALRYRRKSGSVIRTILDRHVFLHLVLSHWEDKEGPRYGPSS
jgi:hypothetical protein